MQAILRVLVYVLYLLVHLVYTAIRNLYWKVTGLDPESAPYERSAHVLGICARWKLDLITSPNLLEDFILCHHGFVHPDWIFREDVSLYQVTSSRMVFVQTGNDTSVWDVSREPFSKPAQHRLARRVIVIPTEHVLRLVRETRYVDRYRDKIIFVGNTARCGSTLLCQILHSTQECVAYSEPGVVNDAYRFWTRFNDPATRDFLKTSFMLLCKKPQNRHVAAHVVKVASSGSYLLPFLYSLFPDTPDLFMYRTAAAKLQSHTRILKSIPLVIPLGLAFYINDRLSDYLHVTFLLRPPGMSDYCRKLVKTTRGFFGPLLADYLFCIQGYIRSRDNGDNVAAIKYEDLVAEPTVTLGRVFSHCGIPTDLIPRTLGVFAVDSQAGSPLMGRALGRESQKASLTPQNREDMRRVCEFLDIPDLSNGADVPGTL